MDAEHTQLARLHADVNRVAEARQESWHNATLNLTIRDALAAGAERRQQAKMLDDLYAEIRRTHAQSRRPVRDAGHLLPMFVRASGPELSARVSSLIADFQMIPSSERPWELVIDHGAGRGRPELLLAHAERFGISRAAADGDWRKAQRALVESGGAGYLTPLVQAQLADDAAGVRRARKLIRKMQARLAPEVPWSLA